MGEKVKIDASVLCEMIERLERKMDRIGERIERAPEVIGLDETNRLLRIIVDILAKEEKIREDIVYITFPSGGGKKELPVGVTKLDFLKGTVTLPDGSMEYMSSSLEAHKRNFCRSLLIFTDQDMVVWWDRAGKRTADANDYFPASYQKFQVLYIETTISTNVRVTGCTNPVADAIFRFMIYPAVERPKSYEGSVGTSPIVLDVREDLGRNGSTGYITNDGPDDLKVYISDDGVNYGGGSKKK